MRDEWSVDRSRLAWWLAGLALAVAFAFVVHSFIGTFVFGIFLYYATRPVYRRMRARIDHPNVAAALSLLLLALPALLLLAYSLAIGLQEFNRLGQNGQLEQVRSVLGPYINASSVARNPQQLLTGQNLGTARGLLDSVTEYVGLIGTALVHLFVMLTLAFYLLRDDHKLMRWFRQRFGDDDGVLDAYLDAVDADYHNVFFGNILNAVLTGSIGAIMYNVLAFVAPPGLTIPAPSLLGLLTGVASLVPIVGMKLVYFPVSAYLVGDALLTDPQTVWFAAAFFLVSLIVVDTIPDLVLRPYVSGRSLHVGMVMLAYIFGPLLFGWYGIFLGPMLLVLIIHFVRIILPELLAGQDIEPWAVEETDLGDESAVDGPGPVEATGVDETGQSDDDPSGEGAPTED